MGLLTTTLLLLSSILLAPLPTFAQAVAVTASLDTNALFLGQTTTLRIFAQVVPAYRTNADRIFSWYVDVLNTNGAAAQANYASMQKSASDNDPQLSSTGTNEGANRRGIYDTFLNRPAAGVTNPVELMSIPVAGLIPGRTRFLIQQGTGVTNLSQDFIVARQGGGAAMTGGDYSLAFVDLLIRPTNVVKQLTITYTDLTSASHFVTLSYSAVAGYDCYLEYRDQLASGPAWQSFPNGPHNSGLYRDTNSVPSRFYRIRTVPSF